MLTRRITTGVMQAFPTATVTHIAETGTVGDYAGRVQVWCYVGERVARILPLHH
jgi:hypothetical protein